MACLWRQLPEDCVSRILSGTSPADVCRILTVSKEFRRPAESNLVWNQFLPSDIHTILPSPINSSSTKNLFFLLSQSILVDDGKKAFALEISTGRKSYILSAADLSIFHNNNTNWTWKSNPESRFDKVGEVRAAERLEIEGHIRSQALSPETSYGAFLVFKISEDAYGLNSIPCETFIASGDRLLATNTATLDDTINRPLHALFYGNRLHKMKERVGLRLNTAPSAPSKRRDGWLEIHIGDFFLGAADTGDITMAVTEIKGHHLKGGLIVEGIHVRPNP